MARRPNYGFQKHQKEMAKQRKKEAKDERKRLKKEEAENGAPTEDTVDSEEHA